MKCRRCPEECKQAYKDGGVWVCPGCGSDQMWQDSKMIAELLCWKEWKAELDIWWGLRDEEIEWSLSLDYEWVCGGQGLSGLDWDTWEELEGWIRTERLVCDFKIPGPI